MYSPAFTRTFRIIFRFICESSTISKLYLLSPRAWVVLLPGVAPPPAIIRVRALAGPRPEALYSTEFTTGSR